MYEKYDIAPEVETITMKDASAEECFFGSVTVGERGQVVIPSDVRKGLHIEPGDRLLVFRHPIGHGIMLTKLDSVQDVVQYFQRAIERINEVSEGSHTESED
jgi:AbrB family looped-hinge helix DNA binding protein